ncbi:nucleotidyltransferase [Nocardia sp. NPDC004654]|uniref:nucleotidyltransferase n=1 Tax=Nocardia sp. NPDC004654 TaxID=3154776 RepID=UPI0033AB67E2
MSLRSYFAKFLDDISLKQRQVDRITSASNALIDFLQKAYSLSNEEIFLQGSYANGTAVKPVDGGEYDVDIVCVSVKHDESADEAINDLFDTLQDHGRYKDKLTPKKPCVRIQYADDDIGQFHVDVVPVRVSQTDKAPLDAPRAGDGWHPTAPNEYTNWCEQQGLEFRQTVQMLKRWRDEHQEVRGAIKSIVLQVLISQHLPADAVDDADRVAQTILGLHNELSSLESPPEVWNPVMDIGVENLAKRWSKESFANFKTELGEAAGLVNVAANADTLVEKVDAWKELFGDAFPSVDKGVFNVQLADTSHAQSPEAKGWLEMLDSRYEVTLEAWSQRGNKGRSMRYPSDGGLLFSGRFIRFKATRTGPTTSSVWWRITNTGKHARSSTKGLRGEFIRGKKLSGGVSDDPTVNWERTSYTGSHLVEVFLVVNSRIVAKSTAFKVNIFNPQNIWQP